MIRGQRGAMEVGASPNVGLGWSLRLSVAKRRPHHTELLADQQGQNHLRRVSCNKILTLHSSFIPLPLTHLHLIYNLKYTYTYTYTHMYMYICSMSNMWICGCVYKCSTFIISQLSYTCVWMYTYDNRVNTYVHICALVCMFICICI